MASSVNSTTMWTPEGGYLNPQNYIQGGNTNYLDPSGNPAQSPLNPTQFATDPIAQGIAGNLVGTVRNDQLAGPGMGYTGADGKPITQAQILTPGNPNAMNAGLVAQNFGQYGSAPGSLGQYNIAGNGSAPSDQTYAQYAMSQPGFKMDPKLGNSGPGYNYAFDPKTGTYTNTATGQTGVTPDQATQQMQQANNLAPSTAPNTPPNTPGPGLSATTVPTGGAPQPGSPQATPGAPSWIPQGFKLGPNGNIVPVNVATPGSSGVTPQRFGIPAGGNEVGDTRAPQPPPPPPQTSGISGPTNQGFSPTGNANEVAPNAQYLSSAGNGNPLSYLRYNDPTTGPFAGQYQPYTGSAIDQMAQNNRNLALGEGAGLQQNLQNYTNFNAGQSADFQQQLASAYSPIASGRGGYTNEQMASILDEPALQALQQTDQQANQNFLTPEEQASISGDPYAAYQQLGADEQGLDLQQNMNEGNVNDYLDAQSRDVNANVNATAGQVRNTYNQTRGDVNSYIDPTALNTSAGYNANYQFGPGDEQAIREQAGRTVGNQELADEERLLQEANQQGNTSPLAIQAARNRMRQTGAVNEANAMSDAGIKAKQLSLGVTQTKENTRLGAAQNYAQLGTSNQQQLGAAQLGAEQYLGTQNQAAQLALGQSNLSNQQQLGQAGEENAKYKATTNLGAGQQAETTASNRAAGIATNRQTTEQANQGTQLARGQYIYGQNNATNLGFANQTLQQQQEYRNYLQNQQTQSNQNQTIGNQQQLGAYGAQTGAANSATAGAIANYAAKPGDPTLPTNLLGVAEGGQFKGPVHALVGEAGPELILTFGHYGDGNSQKAWNGSSGNPEHMAGGYDPTMPQLPGLADSPQPMQQPAQPGQQEASALSDQNPGYSQAPTYAGATHPKNNSLWNSIVAGLGASQGSMTGAYGSGQQGNAAGGSPGILGSILSAARAYQALQAANQATKTGSIIKNEHGGVYGMYRGGAISPAPVTTPPPQWPDVDAKAGDDTTQDTSATVGPPSQSPSIKLPGGGGPTKPGVPPITPTTPATPKTPPTFPPSSQTHTYEPPPPEWPPITLERTIPPEQNPAPRPAEPPLPPRDLVPSAPSTITYPGIGPDPSNDPDPGYTRIGPNPGIGGGEGKPGQYPYPPIIKGGLTGLGESDSTFNPDTGSSAPIKPPSGTTLTDTGTGSLTPPIIPPGGLTGLGKSDSTVTYPPPDRTPWVDPNAWIPGGYGGTPGITPSNPGTGAENHPSWWDFQTPPPPPTAPPPQGTSVDSKLITDPNYTPGSGYGPGSLGPGNPGEGGVLPPQLPGDPGGAVGGSERDEDALAAGGVISSGHHWYGSKKKIPGKGAEFGRYGSKSAFKEPAITRPKMPGVPRPHLPKVGAGMPEMPKVRLVTKPTLMTLGADSPEAVLPLTPRKGNKVTPSMIPQLIEKYGGYGH